MSQEYNLPDSPVSDLSPSVKTVADLSPEEQTTRHLNNLRKLVGERATIQVESWIGQLHLGSLMQQELTATLERRARDTQATEARGEYIASDFLRAFESMLHEGDNFRHGSSEKGAGPGQAVINTKVYTSRKLDPGETLAYQEFNESGIFGLLTLPQEFAVSHTRAGETHSIYFKPGITDVAKYEPIGVIQRNPNLQQSYQVRLISGQGVHPTTTTA